MVHLNKQNPRNWYSTNIYETTVYWNLIFFSFYTFKKESEFIQMCSTGCGNGEERHSGHSG